MRSTQRIQIFSFLLIGTLLFDALPGFAWQPETTHYAIGAKTLVVEPSDTCDRAYPKASIDGRTLMDEGYTLIAPHQRYSEPGFDALVVEVSMGGSGCESMFRIVWVTKDGAFGVTDEFGTCSPWPTVMKANGEITVRFAPTIGDDGEIYRWTLDKGLQAPVSEPFTPDLQLTWRDAAALHGKYCWDAFENSAIYDAARSLLGADFGGIGLASQVGSPIKRTSDGLLTGSCGRKYTRNELFIGIDPRRHRVFAALRLEHDPHWRFYPQASTWPESLQVKLKEVYVLDSGEDPWASASPN